MARKKKFKRSELRKYFEMQADGRNGMWRGHVYIEVRCKGSKDLYKIFREDEAFIGKGLETEDIAWHLVYEGTDVDMVAKHLFMYDAYECFDWDVPYNYRHKIWNEINDYASEFIPAM